jgi:predicted dehydrogenase
MRLGFVGVGRHAQRMAAVFRELGAEVVAYDRASRSEPPELARAVGWGARRTWQDMVADQDIDAIVCCAPPEVTREVALACADTRKRLMATKPTMCRPRVSVDLWRIFSPSWLALKADLQGRTIQSMHVDFYGNGPKRAFSGLLDYAPHALAFVLDLGLEPDIEWHERGPGQWTARDCQERVGIVTGNGFTHPMMYVRVETTDGGQYAWHERDQMQTYEAGGAILLQNWRDLALRSFCRAFITDTDTATGPLNERLMQILSAVESREIYQLIKPDVAATS